MHEHQFTQNIVHTVLEELKKYPSRKPHLVRLKVGEIYHLIPDSVQMHFNLLTQETPLKGTILELQEEVVRVLCHTCQRIGPVEDHHLLVCSFCYSSDVETLSGNRITVESIEFAS